MVLVRQNVSTGTGPAGRSSAVMKIDLVDLPNPIQSLELAFRQRRQVYQLTKFFNRAEVDLIPQRLGCSIHNG
jgi:hypothetical protein